MSQRSRCGNEFGGAFERARSVELQGEMDDAALVLALQSETAVFQHAQHRSIIWQHIGEELAQPGRTRQTRKMAQHGAGYSLPLEFIDDRECKLGCAATNDDVTRARQDDFASTFALDCDEGHLIDEVDLDERLHFCVAEVTPDTEEAALERLIAGAPGGNQQRVAITGPERPDLDLPPVAQPLENRKVRSIGHGLHDRATVALTLRCGT